MAVPASSPLLAFVASLALSFILVALLVGLDVWGRRPDSVFALEGRLIVSYCEWHLRRGGRYVLPIQELRIVDFHSEPTHKSTFLTETPF
jgi:hypothetical protein